MFRFKVTGTLSESRGFRELTVYVTARNREHAADLAFDDMGLITIYNVRRVGKMLKS
jgi:ribosomal protein L20A (L18A)